MKSEDIQLEVLFFPALVAIIFAFGETSGTSKN